MMIRHNQRSGVGGLATVLALGLGLAVALPARSQDEESPEPKTEESLEFLEILLNAKPAPQPSGRVFPEEQSSSEESRALVSRDVESGEEQIYPGSPLGEGELRAPPQEPQWPWSDAEGFVELNESRDIEGYEWELGPDACTPPSPNLFTHSQPWNTNYKLLMRFRVGVTDYYYVCSASSFGSFQLLTAGHCIYNHDPNDDGNTSDARWADEVWAWAAQTDLVNPFDDPDRPYSFAKSVRLVSYVGWTNNSDLNHDMGYITLDRRDGSHTGWMGREANVTASSLNFNGYPAQTPYVPPFEILQYPGFDANNVLYYTTNRIGMCAYVYGGHSGGPDWRFDGTNRYVQGVNSTSNRVGGAEATRIALNRFNDMAAIITDDEANRPPIPRPDIAEFVFTTIDDRKDLLTNSVLQDHPFQIEYNAFNAGFAPTGTVTIDFYLSTNSIISTGDTRIGTLNLSSLSEFNFYNPVTTLNANINPGTYYAGWIMSTGTAEYGGDAICNSNPCSNVVVIADETLRVDPCGDVWEPDNTSGQANTISSGSPQTHSICPIGDEDWVEFTLTEPSEVVLETSGPTGDTRMWLYDSGLGLIEFDDDGGTGNFSRIERTCDVNELPAGTYYVQVDEFGDDNIIDPYTLSFVSDPCPPPPSGCPNPALYCFSWDGFCDGMEICQVLPDKSVVAFYKNLSCGGGTAPLLGGYSGKNVSPRLSWIGGDLYADLNAWSFNLNVDNRTIDGFIHDTLGNLTQFAFDSPYTVTSGACPFSPETAGLPALTDQ